MRNQKGITLIALVVTIIVLLILAGISLAMITGDEGLLNRARAAAEDTKISAVKDEIMLAEQDALTSYLERYYADDLNSDTLQTIVDSRVTAKINEIREYHSGVNIEKVTSSVPGASLQWKITTANRKCEIRFNFTKGTGTGTEASAVDSVKLDATVNGIMTNK